MDKTNNLDIFMTDLADSIREATGETGSINAQSFSTRITGLGTGKQDKLVSGENIKTINGESILGSGDIEIGGGSSSDVYEVLDSAQSYLEIQSNHSYILLANSNQDYIINPPRGSVRLIISAEQFGSITIEPSPKWANDSPIEFEDGKTFEISFLNIDASGQTRILAVWTKYDTMFQGGSNTGGGAE